MKNLGFFESKIISEYITDDIGIDLEKVGKKNTEINLLVDLRKNGLISIRKFSYAILEITSFLKSKQREYRNTGYYRRLLWFRINVIDQADNQYLGLDT